MDSDFIILNQQGEFVTRADVNPFICMMFLTAVLAGESRQEAARTIACVLHCYRYCRFLTLN